MPVNDKPSPSLDDPAANSGRRSRRRSGAVTLHDVALLAGVAPITASRALNTPDRVSDEVRRRVADAVSRTGYVPNLLAGGLASTRSRLVAAVVPSLTGPVFTPTVAALTEALAARGYHLMLGQTGYDQARENTLLEALIGRRPDGVVLTGITHSAQARQRLLAASFPVVETWDLTPTPIDMLVGFSHDEVGRAVARHLHRRGRRRPALVCGNDERARRRGAAFCSAAEALGLHPAPVLEVAAPTTMQAGRLAMAELAQRQPQVDAVFCSSDLLALGVLTEAQVRGLAVPADLAIIGFGDLDFAAQTVPALSTVRVNGADIGRQAAAFIVDRAEGRPVAQAIVDIGFSIVERNSG